MIACFASFAIVSIVETAMFAGSRSQYPDGGVMLTQFSVIATGRRRSKSQSIGPAAFATCFLGRSSPFDHATFEIFEIVVHLLKGKSKGEEAFCRVAGQTSRQTIVTERGDLGGIGSKRRFNGIERRRPLTRPQRGGARTQVIG